jgi:hypothetical protein
MLGDIKLKELVQNALLTKLINYQFDSPWKKIAQSVYVIGCEMEVPKLRISLRVTFSCPFEKTSGAYTAHRSVCASLIHGDKGTELEPKIYRISNVQLMFNGTKFRQFYVSS